MLNRALALPPLTVLTLLTVLTVPSGGCGGDFPDDENLVAGLRVLGARATPAEATPGGAVRLEALVVDPQTATPITVAWSACLLPTVSGSGAVNDDCSAPDPAAAFSTDGGDAARVPLGAGETLNATLPAFSPALLGAADATASLYLPLHLRAATTDATVDAIFRLRVTNAAGPAAPPNQNPVLARVGVVAPLQADLDGPGVTAVPAGARLTLRADFAAGSAEPYHAPDCDGEGRCRTEVLDVTWFSTAGHLDPGRTGDGVDATLDLSVYPPAAGAVVDVWAVAHDQRGGSAFAHGQLRQE